MSSYTVQTEIDFGKHTSTRKDNSYREHPDIQIPDLLKGNGWEDVSWHMEEHPCSQLALPDGSGFKVWVGYTQETHPLKRQTKPQFVVQFYVSLDHQEEPEVIYQGSCVKEALLTINSRRITLLTEILLGSIKE